MHAKTLKAAGFVPSTIVPGIYRANDGYAIRYYRRRAAGGERVVTFDILGQDGALQARKPSAKAAVHYVAVRRCNAAIVAAGAGMTKGAIEEFEAAVKEAGGEVVDTEFFPEATVIVYLRQLPGHEYPEVDRVELSQHTDRDVRYTHMTQTCSTRVAEIVDSLPELRGTKIWGTVVTLQKAPQP